jgi:CO/xanthine dehydrogenase Mo-binding subunit
VTVIGTDVTMVGGLAKVTGTVNYAPDLVLPRMLYAKALRSSYAHAKLLHVDAGKAEKFPGVIAVVTGADLDGLNAYFGPVVDDQPVVAVDRVRHVGEVIALIAAENRDIAEEALDLIDVEYDELPAVFDLTEAVKPDAPVLHTQRNETNAGVHREEFNFQLGGNICSVFRVEDGDVERGFAEADQIFENTYILPPVQHGHIEPHAATAYWEPGGKLVIHTATQNPSGVQEQLAQIFRLPENQVRVIVPPLGGGFGGKTHARIEPALALLARKARRPVQWVLTRDEVFFTGRRYGALVKIKTGVKRDGRIVSREVESFYEIGAYALNGPVNAKTGCYVSSGPYNVPNRRLSTYSVYTNLPPTGPFRGVGVSHVCWAYESEMDDIARKLHIDPLELRLRHLVKEGDVFVTGEKLVSVGIADCLRRAADAIGWRGQIEQAEQAAPPNGARLVRGKGLAVTIKSTTTPTTSSANVRLNADGSAVLLTSSVEMGQGALTSLAQIVGDELGVPFEKVTVSSPDTDVTPYDKSTSSSRTTFHMGQAAQKAAREIRQQLLDVAAKRLEARPDDLELSDGAVSVRGVPNKRMSITEIFKARFGSTVGSMFGGHCFKSAGGLDPKTGKGKAAAFWFFSACGTEVEVDVETGKVRVLDAVTVVDAGKAIHPKQCGLQNEGSLLSGLGSALFEEMVYDNGQPVNSSFVEYVLPSLEDHPQVFRSLLVETSHPDGPYGAKGVGEAALPPVAPAIGNAIANALSGVRVRDLPVKPAKIIAALCAAKQRG